MDLQYVLKEFLHSTYSHLKGIKLCGNLLVRNIFTSDIRYLPNIMEQFGAAKLPKEMSFHVPKGSSFTDLYNFISFPVAYIDKSNVKESVVVSQTKKHHVICEPVGVENMQPQAIENIPMKYPNTTISGQVTSEAQRRQQKQSPSPVIITSEASNDHSSSSSSSSKQGAGVEKRNYCARRSEETKVRMIFI